MNIIPHASRKVNFDDPTGGIILELQGAQALGDVLFEKLFVKDRPDRMAYEMEYDRLVLLNRMNASQVERGLEWLGSLEETLGKMLKEKEGVA